MIVILRLVILVAAVVTGVAGVFGNGGTHGLAHGSPRTARQHRSAGHARYVTH